MVSHIFLLNHRNILPPPVTVIVLMPQCVLENRKKNLINIFLSKLTHRLSLFLFIKT